MALMQGSDLSKEDGDVTHTELGAERKGTYPTTDFGPEEIGSITLGASEKYDGSLVTVQLHKCRLSL